MLTFDVFGGVFAVFFGWLNTFALLRRQCSFFSSIFVRCRGCKSTEESVVWVQFGVRLRLMVFTANFLPNWTVYKRSESLLPVSIHPNVASWELSLKTDF